MMKVDKINTVAIIKSGKDKKYSTPNSKFFYVKDNLINIKFKPYLTKISSTKVFADFLKDLNELNNIDSVYVYVKDDEYGSKDLFEQFFAFMSKYFKNQQFLLKYKDTINNDVYVYELIPGKNSNIKKALFVFNILAELFNYKYNNNIKIDVDKDGKLILNESILDKMNIKANLLEDIINEYYKIL